MQVRGDQNFTRLGSRLEAGRYVGRISHRGVIEPEVVSDGTHDDFARVESDSDLEGDVPLPPQARGIAVQTLLRGQGRADGVARGGLQRLRRPEKGHDAITRVLIDRSPEAVDLAGEDFEAAVHDRVNILGVEPFGKPGEAADVREQNGNLLPLSLEGGSAEQGLNVARRVAAARRLRHGLLPSGDGGCRFVIEAGAAAIAIAGLEEIPLPASGAGPAQSSPAMPAEKGLFPVVVSALRANGHANPPHRIEPEIQSQLQTGSYQFLK